MPDEEPTTPTPADPEPAPADPEPQVPVFEAPRVDPPEDPGTRPSRGEQGGDGG